MAITVYFVRHGETYFNRFARLQGWSDTPLTEKGEMDAKKIGQVLADLRIDYLFSSDLKRAVDTARLLIADHPTATVKEPIQKSSSARYFMGLLKVIVMKKALSGQAILKASDLGVSVN